MAGIFAPLSVLDGRWSSVYFYMQVAHCCWASFCELIPQIDELLMSDQEFCRLTLLVSGCPKSWCKTSKPHHPTLAFYLQCSSKDGGITLTNYVRRNLIWSSTLTTSLPHQCSFLCSHSYLTLCLNIDVSMTVFLGNTYCKFYWHECWPSRGPTGWNAFIFLFLQNKLHFFNMFVPKAC